MSIWPIIKAPLAVQLYRCLFTAGLLYFGSFLRLLHHGAAFSGVLILTSFPLFSLIGLIAAFVPIPLSRWLLAVLGVLIPGISLGALFLWLPDEGWFDETCGVLIWLAVVSVPFSWALVLFKDKRTNKYFSRSVAS